MSFPLLIFILVGFMTVGLLNEKKFYKAPDGTSTAPTSPRGTKSHVLLTIVLFLGIILPILGMFMCPESIFDSNMGTSTCHASSPLLYEYTNFYYTLLFLSGFLFFLPIIVYALVIFGLFWLAYNAR